MKTTVKQSVFTASFLFAIVIVFNSFTVAQKNSMAKGGGIADGIHFSFTVIGQQNGNVVGHMNYGDETYSVVNAEWFGASAILYTDAPAWRNAATSSPHIALLQAFSACGRFIRMVQT